MGRRSDSALRRGGSCCDPEISALAAARWFLAHPACLCIRSAVPLLCVVGPPADGEGSVWGFLISWEREESWTAKHQLQALLLRLAEAGPVVRPDVNALGKCNL